MTQCLFLDDAMLNILMLIKEGHPKFTGFVENKLKNGHEHVMITNLYIIWPPSSLMHSLSLLRMLRRSLGMYLCPSPVDCVAIFQSAGILIWVMWQLERDTSHVPAGVEYPRGGRLEMEQDPEGQSWGYGMTSLHTVPSHIVGMEALPYWKRKLFSKVR